MGVHALSLVREGRLVGAARCLELAVERCRGNRTRTGSCGAAVEERLAAWSARVAWATEPWGTGLGGRILHNLDSSRLPDSTYLPPPGPQPDRTVMVWDNAVAPEIVRPPLLAARGAGGRPRVSCHV